MIMNGEYICNYYDHVQKRFCFRLKSHGAQEQIYLDSLRRLKG